MAKPKTVAPPPRPVAETDASTIAPLRDDNQPNLYNYMPTRLVPKSEAESRGWTYFYEAQPCRYGHVSPRFTKNPRTCVDCHRIKNGKQTIGHRQEGEYKTKIREYKQKQPTTGALAPRELAPVEPDRMEKKFLEAYAELRDFETAAMSTGMGAANAYSRLSYSKVFAAAVNELEDRLGIPRSLPEYNEFEWTQEKRDRFIQVYVDTGDVASARDAIRVTPSEFFKERDRNPDFAEAVSKAEPLAMNALEERAMQLALAGNDKLLTKVLTAKKPEYRDRLSMEVDVTGSLSERQLINRLTRLIRVARERASAIDGELAESEQVATDRSAGAAGGAEQASRAERDPPLLQHAVDSQPLYEADGVVQTRGEVY